MIIKNISENTKIWVTTIDNEVVYLEPWQESEVLDAQGKWYLANYPKIFRKVELSKGKDDIVKDNMIINLELQVEKLTQLVERLVEEKKKENEPEDEGTTEKEEILSKPDEEALKKKLTIELRKRWVEWLWGHWKLATLQKKFNELPKR